ncbi:MAG TPA: AsmA-like C-terminal region-containing protein, partial [Myxococcales bacterium]|nr:AsmA-like C-terminal region-containing protein [Myxococcales bacterium]
SQNVNRLLERIQSAKKEPEPPAGESKPADLSAIRVDLAALVGARIRFIDLGAAQRRELEVNQLNVKVRDLRAGQPLVVWLNAAVFAAQENLAVELHAAPLPPSLVPTPVQVSIKAKGIDLSPLGPFLGKDVGLEKGTLDADWSADLGAAVPGGAGPTRLKGTVRASGLRFAGAEVSKPLDVAVDTDVKGDVEAGDLQLDRLDVAVGPVVARGKGEVKGLTSETPSVKGLEISIPRLDPAELGGYVPAVRKALGGQAAGPASLSVRASGTAASQAVDVDADLTGMRLDVPKQLSKAAGAPMKLSATVSGAQRALKFKADANLLGVDLRPGGDVNKPPGQPLAVSARGTFAKKAGETHVVVDALKVDILQQQVSGTAKVDLAGKTTQVSAKLESPKLDLDQLLYDEPAPPGEKTAAAPPAPPKDPHRFDGLRIDAAVKAGSLRVEKTDLENVNLEMSMVDDAVTIKKLTAGAYGGQVVADGTSIKLGPAQRPFHAALKVRDVDVARAAASHTDKKFLAGKFSGDVAVDGVGTKVTALSQTMEGSAGGSLNDGKLLGVDVMSAASGPLAKALPFAGQALQNANLTDLGKELPFSVTVDHGVAKLKNPISFTRPEGNLSLQGGVHLDGELDLAGLLNLSPEAVSKITRGKVVPKEPFPLPLKITGPAWKPNVAIVDLKTPVAALVKLAAGAAASRLLGERGKQIVDMVSGGQEKVQEKVQEEAAAKQKELEARAAEEKAKAEAAAREEAEKAKKRLEDEAKKRLQNLFGPGK